MEINMRTKRKSFAPLQNNGRRASRKRIARIDTALKTSEIDVFAGYAEELYSGLARMVDSISDEIEDAENQIFYTERDLKDAEARLLQSNEVYKKFEGFSESLYKAERSDIMSSLNDLEKSLSKAIDADQNAIRHYKQKLKELGMELDLVSSDPVYEALVDGNKLDGLDQDDSISGLTAFSSALAEVISAAGEDDFLFDLLGGGAREFINMMERVGL